MRIIYEDGSGEPLPQSNPPKQDTPQPQEPQGVALPQLTPEQIAALLQLLQTQQAQNAQQAAPAPEQPAPSAPSAEEKAPAGSKDPGMRIVFQSPDFEKKERKQSKPSFGANPDPGMRIAYSEDPAKMPPQPKEPMKPAHRRSASAANFSVNEFSLDLPSGGVRVPSNFPVGDMAVQEVEEASAPAQSPPSSKREKRRKEKPAREKKERKPKKRGKSKLRSIILTVSLLAIAVSAGVLVWEYKLHKDNLQMENELSNLIVTQQSATNVPGDIGNSVQLTEEQQWAQIKGEFPHVTFPKNLQLKYARLYGTNPDFVGYMEIPALNLSLPVVQTSNDDEYLHKNFYGKSTKYGCPFVSCINRIDTLDFNTVIYGHHMNDRTIFGALDAYQTIDGFRKAPVITFNTLYRDYQWKVIAAFLTNSVPDDDNGYVFNYYFNRLSGPSKQSAYLQELAQRSFYHTGVDVSPTDRLLTLSTCSHIFDDARLVVVARLVREGESAEVDTSLATLNANVRYPQVYYTKKKQTNPYAQAPRWELG